MATDREIRWKHDTHPDIPRVKGVLKNLHKFDNTFFGVHSKQAQFMDPQGRLLLEVAYEAIMDSGIHPHALRNSNIGVYTAVCYSDSEKAQLYNSNANSYNMIG